MLCHCLWAVCMLLLLLLTVSNNKHCMLVAMWCELRLSCILGGAVFTDYGVYLTALVDCTLTSNTAGQSGALLTPHDIRAMTSHIYTRTKCVHTSAKSV
jgi:hypothetical protein